MRTLQFILLGGLALGLGVLLYVGTRSPSTEALVSGLRLNEPRALPPIQLIDDQGERFANAELQGRWHLVFAGFTHCPDFCPNTLATLKLVQEALGEDAERLQVLFFSVDPQRDQPEQLAQYTRYFHPEFRGITGEAEQVERFAQALGLAYSIVPAEEGAPANQYTVDHSAALVLLNPQGRIEAYFSAPHRVDTLTADLRSLVAGPA